MGKVVAPNVSRPKGIQVTLPRDLAVLSAHVDGDGNTVVINTNDGRICIDSNMLIQYEDLRPKKPVKSVAVTRSSGITETEKIEKLFSQPKELFEAVDFSSFGIMDELDPHTPKFIEGENYSLKGIACDGFEMETKVYKLIKVVDDFYGSPLNSVIVKQIAGEKGRIFTLSKNDCAYHGIDYEDGLQLFPKTLPWTRVKETIPFDAHNLGTTPLSDVDNTIRYIVFRLDGFKDYLDGYVLTPSGHLVTEKHFEQTLRVTTIEPIVYGNGYVINDKTNLDIEFIYPKHLLFNHANFISSEDTIFLMVKLKREYVSPVDSNTNMSIDGYFGVESQYFDGINPNDFFTISWDELGAQTIEEYEVAKAERARKEAERAKKLEEERKRKIAEEEQRIKERRQRAEKAADRMREYGMRMPTFPPMPRIAFNGSISSIDMIVNSLDTYFDGLNKSLSILNEDLGTMAKLGGCELNRIITNSHSRRNGDTQFNKLLKLLK